MSIAPKCTCGKYLYYCGNGCPNAMPIIEQNVQASVATEVPSSNTAKDKNPSNSINNSPEQWKEEWKQKLDRLKRHLHEAKEARYETTEGLIWHEIKGMEKAESFFLPIIERLQERNEKLVKLFESLTPGGSEFYNDPEYCAEFIKQQIQGIPKAILPFKQQIQSLQEKIKKLEGSQRQ